MRPARELVEEGGQTYFVTSQTILRTPFFRHARWATLFQEVLQQYRKTSYLLHAYVIMPDHFHILISPQESLERAVQNVKGGFSFRAKRAFDWKQDIWQPGFSDHRIRNCEDLGRHLAYIKSNPTRARLCERIQEYPYLSMRLDPIPQRLKPLISESFNGGAEAPPLQPQGLKPLGSEIVISTAKTILSDHG